MCKNYERFCLKSFNPKEKFQSTKKSRQKYYFANFKVNSLPKGISSLIKNGQRSLKIVLQVAIQRFCQDDTEAQ
jgi:hypothetical protein